MTASEKGRPLLAPHRVWSLWEMLGPHGYNIWALARSLAGMEEAIGQIVATHGQEGRTPVPETVFAPLMTVLSGRDEGSFANDHLPMTLAQVERIQRVAAKGCTLDQMRSGFVEMSNRAEDELRLAKFLAVDRQRVALYERKQLFGDAVETALPAAIGDIEDAGRCIAVGQGTAAVFHLMRVMEAALKRLAKALDVAYAPSWESYLRKINERIDAKHQTKSVEWKRDEAFFRDLAGDLGLVKLAWRNPTMHIERRYSPDEAHEIFVAVKAFCRRLAGHVSLRTPLALPSPALPAGGS